MNWLIEKKIVKTFNFFLVMTATKKGERNGREPSLKRGIKTWKKVVYYLHPSNLLSFKQLAFFSKQVFLSWFQVFILYHSLTMQPLSQPWKRETLNTSFTLIISYESKKRDCIVRKTSFLRVYKFPWETLRTFHPSKKLVCLCLKSKKITCPSKFTLATSLFCMKKTSKTHLRLRRGDSEKNPGENSD